MKKITQKGLLLFCLAALVLTGCTDPDGTKSNESYVTPSKGALSFMGMDNEPQTLNVKASAEWSAEPSATWIKLSAITEESMVVTVENNSTERERDAKIIITSGEIVKEVLVNQLPKEVGDMKYRRPFWRPGVISPNGKYIGGYSYDFIGDAVEGAYTAIIIDMATDEHIEFGPFPKTMFSFTVAQSITDDGKLFISDGGGSIMFDAKTGEYEQMQPPTGFNYRPSICSASADGSIMVGYVRKAGVYYPLVWEDGVAKELPWPPMNFRDTRFEDTDINGILAVGVSHDGRFIYGSTWDNDDMGMLYWDRQNNYAVSWVSPDKHDLKPVDRIMWDGSIQKFNLVDAMTSDSTPTRISPNGKYIAGVYRTEELAADGARFDRTWSAAFYNTETKKTVIFDEFGESSGMAVSDDGIGFIALGRQKMTKGMVVDVETGVVLGTTEEWVLKTYGMHVPPGFISYMCPGNRVMMGLTCIPAEPQPMWLNWYMAPKK